MDDVVDFAKAAVGSMCACALFVCYMVILAAMYVFFGMIYFVAEFFVPLGIMGIVWVIGDVMLDCEWIHNFGHMCYMSPTGTALIVSSSEWIQNQYNTINGCI